VFILGHKILMHTRVLYHLKLVTVYYSNMVKNKYFSAEEANQIGDLIGIDWTKINREEFKQGLSIELEHGSHDPETNVINDDPQLAGKIAWAHLKEIRDYYTRLKKMETEAEAYWEQINLGNV